MKYLWETMAIVLFTLPLRAAEKQSVIVTPIISSTVTDSGQPILVPQHDTQVTVSLYEIAAGAELPEHKHPFPRFGYILSGTLRVINCETGNAKVYKAGDFVIESIGQWHKGANIGIEPLKLLVIDLTERGQSNVLLKRP
jgi:quercetin dioxygenase-like cupin family protein